MINGVPLYQAKAELFRSLGHPVRIRVLELLAERDHAVYELLEQISVEQANLSQQLAVLRRTGLVSQRREGGVVLYSLVGPEAREAPPVGAQAVASTRLRQSRPRTGARHPHRHLQRGPHSQAGRSHRSRLEITSSP